MVIIPKTPGIASPESVVWCGKEFPAPTWWPAQRDALVYHGDVRAQLRRLPARSVHCCITSPPYFGLRSYLPDGHDDKEHEIGMEQLHDCETYGEARCGCYVCVMVEVFEEVRRVLRDDGCVFLNIGDSYAGSTPGRNDVDRMYGDDSQGRGLPSGNLVGVPWRVALALQASGWILRQDIIWAKNNPMPESVNNRCTKAHEYIFLLAKAEGYYYDNEAIREEPKPEFAGKSVGLAPPRDGTLRNDGGRSYKLDGFCGANKRSVWNVSTKGYDGVHFATYSKKLIEPCILAGTSVGCCAACGAPHERVTAVSGGAVAEPDPDGRDRSIDSNRNGITGSLDGEPKKKETVGWRATCACSAGTASCIVLDPFLGSGTTAMAAIEHGRRAVGIDLNLDYIRDHAAKRIGEATRGLPEGAVMPPPKPLTPKRVLLGRSIIRA